MSFPIITNAPNLTTAQMIEVDRLMIEEFGISLIQMMENAGRGLAIVARERFFNGQPEGRKVLVLAGPGGNGGGAMVAARRLAAWGADVSLVLSHSKDRITPVPTQQLAILHKMNVPILSVEEAEVKKPELIIDGLLGYSLKGAPRGNSAKLVEIANEISGSGTPILALDVPSGLDASSGTIYQPAIKATATLTLALPKTGLTAEKAREMVGELFCADISVPRALYLRKTLALTVPNIFASSDIVQLHQ